jgi:hypothetical protein
VPIVLLAAVLAVTAVGVAERVEDRVIEAPVTDTSSLDVSNAIPSASAPSVAATTPDAPLTSAVLPSGTMALTLSNGSATITTGVDAPALELATTTIGDVDLGALADDVVIAQADGEVSYDWGDVTEWYRTVPDGIEHGYTIDAPVTDSDELTVTVEVTDGMPTLIDADTVTIERSDATSVWYRGLVAFDAYGTDLPAEMDVVDGAIELQVDITGAAYPITIDPVFSDAGTIRPTVGAPQLTAAADTARLAGTGLAGPTPAASCADGSVMTGLTAYPRFDGSNQLRLLVPRCRELEVVGGALQFAGPAVDAPGFGNVALPVLAAQTRECAEGSAMTGLVADVGLLIDRVAIRCVPLLGPDAVGVPTTQSDFYGGGSVAVLRLDPVDCAASFATGLQGTAGDDIASVGLQCEVVGGRFGFAVDVDGNRMVVSAPWAPLANDSAGEVRVYDRLDVASPWVHTATLTRPNLLAGSRFGDSVSVRGDLIAVGESDRLGDEADAGRVWVYSFDGSVWEQLGDGSALQQPVPTAGDRFGADIEWVSDTVLAIGAPGAVADRGNVFIAQYNDVSGTWSYSDLVTVLAGFGAAPRTGDEFGYAIGYDDSTAGIGALVVGSPGFDASFPSESDNGAAYRFFGAGAIFNWNGTFGFIEERRVGTSVDVSGNRFVVGGYGSGAIEANAYEFVSGSWAGLGGQIIPGEVPGANDGQVNDYLALDGDLIAVGRGGNGGGVSVYRIGDTWPSGPPTEIEPTGRAAGDRVGWSLAVEDTVVAMGAPGDDGATNQLFDSGALYTFRVPVTATFVNPTQFAAWENPANWDVGVVPAAGDAAIVPFGTYPQLGVGVASTVDTLSVAGQLRIRGDLRVGTTSTIAASATVDLQSSGSFDPSDDLLLDGVLSNDGVVVLDGPASVTTFTGNGRVINDGELRKTGPGTATIGPDVVFTSRFYSDVNVTSGSLEILGDLFDDNGPDSATVTAGTFRVAAGTSLVVGEDGVVGDDLIVGPGTTFVTEITGPPSSTASYGRIVVGSGLGFDRTVPNPGPGLVGFEAIVNGYDVDVADVYPVITCGNDCAPDLGGGVLSVEFDDLALGGLTPVQTRLAIDLRTVANKIVAPDSGVGFGTDVSVDGDWAVVGQRTGDAQVYEFVGGDWDVRQALSGASAEKVALDGNTIFTDGVRFTRPAPGVPFVSDQVTGGTTFDVDGRLVVRGFGDGTAVVRFVSGGPDEPLVPSVANPSFGADVAIVDLGGASAIAAVAAPAAGLVYLFDLAVDELAGTVSATPRGSVSGGTDFGRSIALSADRLVVGAPFDGVPVPGAGAAWVYERVGPGATFDGDPTKLQASDAGGSDTLGDDVAIDGDVIVVGAPIAQKFAFPLRDGAAYVFQHNGAAWVETDILRAADGFSEELFGDAVAVSGNRVLVGAPNDANDNGPDAGAFYFYETTPLPPVAPEEPVFGAFDFGASTTEVSVASSGIAASAIPSRTASGASGQAGSVASTSLVGIDLNRPVGSNLAASPIASLTIGESVISAIDGPSALDTLPLSDIDITVPIEGSNPVRFGGWEEILRQIGSAVLQARPPQNIRFAEIKSFPQVQRLRLDQITLAGTPIASLPIASLVLGSTPIASLSTDIDWCAEIDAVSGSAGCGGVDPADTTLVELTLAGIPIASLPIASLPIASLPIASLPIASLPIASLDLASTPIASLPIASLGPVGTPIASLPIASLPIASLQVSGTPIASLPIASLPIASLPIASLPIASLPVGALPLAGTPIASLATDGSLASIPIASLEVTGTPIASLPIASLPIASLPIASLPIASLPIASLPIASLPIASLDVAGTPIASLTVDGTLATLPIASLPIASLPIASLPIASLPIASLPIASLPIASLPIASLPIASLPIASLPIASLEAVVDCGEIDCTSPDISLAEALELAPRAGVTFETFAPLIAGLRWSEVLPVLGLSEAEFTGILVNLTNATGGTFTIGDALDFGDLTVGELPRAVLEQLFLGDLAPYLDGLRLGDLVDIVGPDGELLDRTAVERALTDAKDQLTTTLGSVVDFDDLTLGDLVDENGEPTLAGLTLAQVAPFLEGLRFDDLLGVFPGLTETEVRDAFDVILSNSSLDIGDLLVGDMTFDDLFGGDDFGALTLGALLTAILAANPNALDGITLGDLLLAFVAPSDYPWDEIVFDEIDPADIPGLVGAVTFDVDFEVTGSTRGQSVEVSVTLPDTVGYLPGTTRLDGVVTVEPTVVGNVLTWRLSALAPDTAYTLSFDLQPTLELGSSTVGVTARIVGAPAGSVERTSSVAVQQAFEPNDDPSNATPLDDDTIYINHVASADDVDFFRIDVTAGQRLVVSLSNLAADFDVVVYGRSQTASILPLVPPSGQSAGAPVPDPVFEPGGATQVQTELTGAATTFDGLPIVATGNRRGTATETLVTPPLEAGTVYVKAFGANGESSVRAAVLQAKVTEGTAVPECPALTLSGGVPGAPQAVPADANTLILVNQERLSALHPAGSPDPYTAVMTELDELVGFLNGSGSGLGIVPGVLDVGRIAGIADDYATWDAEPCDSAKANAVVAEITAEITELRRTRDIDHILVVGGDDIVPMARVTDGAEISNEFDYRFTFGGNNAVAGSAWDRQILTDEPYGETAALNYGDRFLYITDTALGRLVDTPAEIAFQLDQFVTSQGRLDPQTGLVMGYDFLDDGSEAVTGYLDAAGLDVDDEFGSGDDDDTWDADDLAEKLFPSDGSPTPDLISLNAHFDHRRALPALGNSIGDETDLFEATRVFAAASGALTGRVTFSMGCHSGLNVSDATIGVLADDFPQAFTAQGGIYIGNTGYGYGDTETVAYSERLMGLFARELVNPVLFDQPTTAGQALQFAKNVFFSELGNVSVYDEKALMEATFYGVPFYRVTTTPAEPQPVPTLTTQADPITGDPSVTFTVTPTNEEVPDLDSGVKFVNRNGAGDPLELKSPFNPAQPLELVDVSVVDPADPSRLDLVARGALVTGLTSTYRSPIDPVIVRPVVDDSTTQPEPMVQDVVFPVEPTAIRSVTVAEGERQTLALATGQFAGSSTSGVQRLDDRLDVVVYYAPTSQTDYTAPTIRSVESFVVDGQLSITAQVTDVDGESDPGTGVDRVYVLVAQNPGTGTVDWIGVELAEASGLPGRWVGSVQLDAGVTDVQLFAQAKDGAGNIGVSTNKGLNFESLEVDEPEPSTVLAVTIDGVPADDAGNVWFDDNVVVTAGAGDLPVEYRLNNGPLTTFPTSGLVVSAEGVNRLIVTATNGDEVDRVIRIDRTDPTVVIVSPVDGTQIPVGSAITASFSCSDTSLVSCIGTLDGAPVTVGADLTDLAPGEYELAVTALDSVGRTTRQRSEFRVTQTSPQAPPEITLVNGTREPQSISATFAVEIEFTDANFDDDDYTVTVDWGDGDEDTPDTSTVCTTSSTGGAVVGNPTCEVLASPSADGPGVAVANFRYDAPGVYAITVTVDDGTESSVSIFQFATIYDRAAGRVTGSGTYWSGPETYAGGWIGRPAFFGYDARYRANDVVPRGTTKLHLLGEFLFTSTSYDYLIVNDTFAVAAGTGKFNGRSGHDFRVQGIDNGRVDFFQLTIWNPAGDVVYDNGVKYEGGQLVEAPEGDRVLLGGIRILR